MGLALGAVFVRRQSRLADPLIDLDLFRVPAFSASLAVYTLGILVLFGSFLFIYQYLQLVLELSPLMAGVVTLPSFAAFVVGSMLAPVFVKRVRPAYVTTGGLALAAVGLLGLTQLSAESGLGILIGRPIVYSLGIAPVFTLTNDLILGNRLPRKPAPRRGSPRREPSSVARSRSRSSARSARPSTGRGEDSIPASVPADEAERRRTPSASRGRERELPPRSRIRFSRRRGWRSRRGCRSLLS